MTFEISLPIRTYIYRVVVDAPASLRLDVDGMPRAIRFEDQGRSLLGTEIQRQPGDAQLQHLMVTLHGIPGPGPLRWIALGIALVIVLAGAAAASRRAPKSVDLTRQSVAERKRVLLDELKELELEYESGEVGPAFRQSRRSAIVRTLAALLHEEDRLGGHEEDRLGGNASKQEPRTSRG
jgi:hypothetical protein